MIGKPNTEVIDLLVETLSGNHLVIVSESPKVHFYHIQNIYFVQQTVQNLNMGRYKSKKTNTHSCEFVYAAVLPVRWAVEQIINVNILYCQFAFKTFCISIVPYFPKSVQDWIKKNIYQRTLILCLKAMFLPFLLLYKTFINKLVDFK